MQSEAILGSKGLKKSPSEVLAEQEQMELRKLLLMPPEKPLLHARQVVMNEKYE